MVLSPRGGDHSGPLNHQLQPAKDLHLVRRAGHPSEAGGGQGEREGTVSRRVQVVGEQRVRENDGGGEEANERGLHKRREGR